MLSFIPKKSVQLTMHSRLSLKVNHACKDKWLGIQVHSQNKIKEKPASNMVNDKRPLQNNKLGQRK